MIYNFPNARGRSQRIASSLTTCGLLWALTAAGCADTALEDPDSDDAGSKSDEGDDDETPGTGSDAEADDDNGDRSGDKDEGDASDEAKATPAPDDDEDDDEPGASAPKDAGAASNEGWCEVEPIIEKYCSACHDGEGTGPMPLLTAADFAADSPITVGRKVYETVSARLHDTKKPMPPPPKKVSEDELAILDAWLAAEAPAADKACAEVEPAEGDRVDGWDPEACDEIYELRSHAGRSLDAPYTVPPGGEIHPQIRLDAPWGDEKVQAIGFKPLTDNKKVLHHWILNGFGRTFLAGWAPGDEARPPFPDDVGMDMPSGPGAFTLDMHYYNLTGTTTEADQSGVAICVLKGANMRKNLAAVTGSFSSIGAGGVLAPRQSVDAPATSVCNVTLTGSEPVHLLTAAPHAHKYASHMKFTVTKKDGTEIVMHDEPWVYGEQGTYPLPGGEVLIETGDTVTTVCSYTNMTSRDIRFGQSTEDEMCFNFALYYPKGGFSCGGGRGGFGN